MVEHFTLLTLKSDVMNHQMYHFITIEARQGGGAGYFCSASKVTFGATGLIITKLEELF